MVVSITTTHEYIRHIADSSYLRSHFPADSIGYLLRAHRSAFFKSYVPGIYLTISGVIISWVLTKMTSFRGKVHYTRLNFYYISGMIESIESFSTSNFCNLLILTFNSLHSFLQLELINGLKGYFRKDMIKTFCKSTDIRLFME